LFYNLEKNENVYYKDTFAMQRYFYKGNLLSNWYPHAYEAIEKKNYVYIKH
jgi:hypothetical protein